MDVSQRMKANLERSAQTPDVLEIHPPSTVPEDATFVRELRLEALASHPESFAADYASTEAESVEVWTERIVSYNLDSQGVICVAATGNQVIGMSGLFRGNRPKTRHSGTIWGVYVQADWRGLHLAEALLEECIGWAKAQGLVIVKLAVITTNAPAIRCYTHCGFTAYGIDPKVICNNDIFYDELLMAKVISIS